jgi:hypothetical protein
MGIYYGLSISSFMIERMDASRMFDKAFAIERLEDLYHNT